MQRLVEVSGMWQMHISLPRLHTSFHISSFVLVLVLSFLPRGVWPSLPVSLMPPFLPKKAQL